ncbi:G-protein-signaling modulator 1 [Lepisosteus oculatus]|uniref:G-protein-signaling modulator 1 n=1 Tax=Lepisosteus oculatus TaxID=7918 RepID=UPI0035F50CBD
MTAADSNTKGGTQSGSREGRQRADTEHTEADSFFQLLSQVQGGRLDEQRCPIDLGKTVSTPSGTPTAGSAGPEIDDLFDLLMTTQSHRLDDQRVSLGPLPCGRDEGAGQGAEQLCSMVFKLQGSRMEDQRCPTPGAPPGPPRPPTSSGPIAPGDDYFSFINHVHTAQLGKKKTRP